MYVYLGGRVNLPGGRHQLAGQTDAYLAGGGRCASATGEAAVRVNMVYIYV